MNIPEIKQIERSDSLDDFEFFDAEGDLDFDLQNSSVEEAVDSQSSGISWIFLALSTIVEEQGWTIVPSVEAMAATAVGAIAGSLIGGPSGLAIGLITGAVMAYRTSPKRVQRPKPEETKSTIRQIFSEMTPQQKKELLKELLNVLKQSKVKNVVVEMVKNEDIRNVALGILGNFLKKKMGMCLTKAK